MKKKSQMSFITQTKEKLKVARFKLKAYLIAHF